MDNIQDLLKEEEEIKEEKERRKYWAEVKLTVFGLLLGLLIVIFTIVLALLLSS
ncbi:MAG TPA: hypothetical protein PLP70_02410 [bacterium]|jgi:cell division septal protein FtsQ|nr:hypothetical protein [bacterium]